MRLTPELESLQIGLSLQRWRHSAALAGKGCYSPKLLYMREAGRPVKWRRDKRIQGWSDMVCETEEGAAVQDITNH